MIIHSEKYNVKTVQHESEALSFMGPEIWSLVPSDIKNSEPLEIFKQKITHWKPDNRPYRLCKTFIKGLWYL